MVSIGSEIGCQGGVRLGRWRVTEERVHTVRAERGEKRARDVAVGERLALPEQPLPLRLARVRGHARDSL